MKTIKNFALAASVFAASASASVAATFAVNGTEYDVTTFTGFYDDNAALLQSQVWWGNSNLAGEFAVAVGDALGVPNCYGSEGPYFAWEASVSSVTFDYLDNGVTLSSGGTTGLGSTAVFAVATEMSPVPLPAGVLLLVTGLGAVAAVKRRSKRGA